MKRISILGGVVAVGALAALATASMQSGAGLVSNFGKALKDSKGLSVRYTVQVVGGTAAEYSMELSKPNMAHLETPGLSIYADGKTIVEYDKREKTWFKRPQVDSELLAMFDDQTAKVWAAFFDEKLLEAFKAGKSTGTRNRKGVNLTGVETVLGDKGQRTVTLYFSADGLVKQATFETQEAAGKVMLVMDAQEVKLGPAMGADKFAFSAPAGSRQITEEELTAGKWYTNLDEALAAAKKTNRMVLIDFGAEW